MTKIQGARSGRAVAAALIGVLLLAACGGDDAGNSSTSNAGKAEERTTTTDAAETASTESTDTTLGATITAVGSPSTTISSGATTTAAPRTTLTTMKPAGSKATTTTRPARPGTSTTTVVGGGGITKGTIKIGTIGTSIIASSGAKSTEETAKIAKAWETTVNNEGGINGYKVQVIYKDGRADSSRILQAARELDEAGVLVIAGQGVAQQISPTASFLLSKKLPVVGGIPYTPEFDDHPMFFPVSSSYFAGVYAQVAAARDAGGRSFLNAYCTEVAACAQSAPVTKEAAAREGLRHYQQAASAVASDYTSVCLFAKQNDVEFFQSNGLNFAGVVRDCSRQNYHPVYGVGGAANDATLAQANGERLAGSLYDFGLFYNGPEVQRFRTVFGLTGLTISGTGQTATQTSVQTFAGLEMAGAVIKKLTQAAPSRADFLNALYTIKGETLGGIVAPADYTVQKPGTGQHSFNDCWFEHIVKDGVYYHMNKSGQTVNRLTPICGTGHKYPMGNY